MSRTYGWHQFHVLPDDLIAYAWSAPMRDLAGAVAMSDVGLKKLLRAHGIGPPPQGYWNKVHAGRPVPKPPRAPARRPGETGRISLDQRFAKVLKPAPLMSSTGPFASVEVPEDLNELLARELKAIGRIAVPRTLEQPHPGLHQLLKQEQRRREKANEPFHWDTPKFDGPFDQRRLRLLNGLFLGLSKRGHFGDLYERDGVLHVGAIIGDTRVGFSLELARQKAARSRMPQAIDPQLPVKAPLALVVVGEGGARWEDGADGTLETRLASLVAGLIVAGEARFRRSLAQAEEWEQQRRVDAERGRRERLASLNQKRLEQLHASGQLLRQAEDLRALAARVGEAVAGGALTLEPGALEAWLAWASAEADRLDPVLSGQVISHVLPPAEEPGREPDFT